jgi:lipopolysaccharide export system permease protein
MRLYLHILRAHVGPFIFSFVTIMFIFLLQYVMKFVDQLVGKGLGAWVITQLMVLNLAWMVVLAAPMSVLVATLMAFGGMSAQNEITAMKACGVSLYRMMAPVVIASLLLTYGVFKFNNDVLPDANHLASALTFDIRNKKPTLTIEAGLFNQDISGYSILVRKTFEHSNNLEGVTIYDYTNPGQLAVITGERGVISFTPDHQKLVMDLTNGEIHQIQPGDRNSYRRIRYEKHRIVMNASGFDFERSGSSRFDRGDRELSAQAMTFFLDSLRRLNNRAVDQISKTAYEVLKSPFPSAPGAAPFFGRYPAEQSIDRAFYRARSLESTVNNQLAYVVSNNIQIDRYKVEINKKYSIPVACLVFVFVGVPLGIMTRRGNFGVAATLSIGFFVLYWACLIAGEKLADRSFLAPWVGMWIANIILAVLGIYLTTRTANENPYIRWSRLRRFVPKSLQTPERADEEE